MRPQIRWVQSWKHGCDIKPKPLRRRPVVRSIRKRESERLIFVLRGRWWDVKLVTYPMPSTVRLQRLYWESHRFLLSTLSSCGHVCNSGFPETCVEAFNTCTWKFIHWLLERILILGKQNECHGIRIICKRLTKLIVFRNFELCTIV